MANMLRLPGEYQANTFCIFNAYCYDLDRAVISSGYPKSITPLLYDTPTEADYKRATALYNCATGTGHDSWAKAVAIHYDIQSPAHMFMHMMRYHFQDIASSQSKFHRLGGSHHDVELGKIVADIGFNLDQQLDVTVTETTKNELIRLRDIYRNNRTEANLLILLNNVPSGLLLCARITNNLLQLKGQFIQRKNHSGEWRAFCSWYQRIVALINKSTSMTLRNY